MNQQLQGQPAIVVFDLDGTITRYDTYVRFLLLAISRNPVKLFQLPVLSIDVLRHKLGWQSNTWLKKRFLRAILAGKDRKTINSLAATFSQRVINAGLHDEAIECLRHYQDKGNKLVLLSASLDIYVETLGKILGFKHIICTRTLWHDDILSSELDGGNCYGEAKIERIKLWLADHSDNKLQAAFGDHLTDFPLLKMAEQGFVVNPDKALRQEADANHLQHVYWN